MNSWILKNNIELTEKYSKHKPPLSHAFRRHSVASVPAAVLIRSRAHFRIWVRARVARVLHCFHFIRAKVYLTRRTFTPEMVYLHRKSSFTPLRSHRMLDVLGPGCGWSWCAVVCFLVAFRHKMYTHAVHSSRSCAQYTEIMKVSELNVPRQPNKICKIG